MSHLEEPEMLLRIQSRWSNLAQVFPPTCQASSRQLGHTRQSGYNEWLEAGIKPERKHAAVALKVEPLYPLLWSCQSKTRTIKAIKKKLRQTGDKYQSRYWKVAGDESSEEGWWRGIKVLHENTLTGCIDCLDQSHFTAVSLLCRIERIKNAPSFPVESECTVATRCPYRTSEHLRSHALAFSVLKNTSDSPCCQIWVFKLVSQHQQIYFFLFLALLVIPFWIVSCDIAIYSPWHTTTLLGYPVTFTLKYEIWWLRSAKYTSASYHSKIQ